MLYHISAANCRLQSKLCFIRLITLASLFSVLNLLLTVTLTHLGLYNRFP